MRPSFVFPLLIVALSWSSLALAADGDGDGVEDAVDNCPAISNAQQNDADDDGVGNVCDNCRNVPNPRASVFLRHRSYTGGQLDDDADGYGNACDAKFLPAGSVVGGLDLAEMIASFNKAVTGNDCGTTGDRSCAEFDLDGLGAFVAGTDLSLTYQLFNAAPGPRCSTCPRICIGNACGVCEDPGGVTANFEDESLTIREDAGTVEIDLVFDAAFSGTLPLIVKGTANPTDFGAISVERVNDLLARISVPIVDDSELGEPIEWIALGLAPCAGIDIGPRNESRITILDNDAVWDGILDVDGAEIDFALEIVRTPGNVAGQLRGRGGVIPAGSFPANVTLSDTSFSTTASGIDISGASAGLQSMSELSLTLSASDTTPDERVEDNRINGAGELQIDVSGSPHLDRSVQGTFNLTQRPPRPSESEVELVEVLP